MRKCKIRKGDKVIITTGKDKGRVGDVLEIIFDRTRNDFWCKVSGMNMQSHYVKANPQANQPGSIDSREGKINISNVALADANGKASKVTIEVKDGSKQRILKTTGEPVVANG